MTMRMKPWLATAAGLLVIGMGQPAIAQTASPQPPPTFEQVLSAPDDPELNLRFAIAAAQSDDLLAAEAAVQRVLILQPEWHSARLLYAAILFRMENYQDADIQLKMVDNTKLTQLEVQEAARYRQLIAGQRSLGRFSGQLAAGLAYQADVSGALANLPLSGTTRDSGVSGVVWLNLDGDLKLGDGATRVFGTFNGYSRSASSGPDNDLQLGEVVGGFRGNKRLASWQVGLAARRYSVFGDDYLTETGLSAHTSYRSSPSLTWTFSMEAVRQDFDEPAVTALAGTIGGTRDGDRYGSSVMLSWRPDSQRNLWGLVGAERKTADYRPFGYKSPRVGVGFDAKLGPATLSGMTELRLYDYEAGDTFFLSGAKREENLSRTRLSLDAPLSAFTQARATGGPLDRITLMGAVDYSRRDAKAPLTDHSSWGGELSLIWRFGDVQK